MSGQNERDGGKKAGVRFSLSTLLIGAVVVTVVLAFFGRLALGMVSLDQLRQFAPYGHYLSILAFLFLAASYSGASEGDKAFLQFRYAIVGVLVGVLVGPMLCWYVYRPERDSFANEHLRSYLLWAPLGALVGGLFVVAAVRFLWWYREHLARGWWAVGAIILLSMPAFLTCARDWNHPERAVVASLRGQGFRVRRSDFTGNAIGIALVERSDVATEDLVLLIPVLKQLDSLQWFHIVDCPEISQSEVTRLRTELPMCRIKKY